MSEHLQCWKCGAAVAAFPPIERADICASCRADLHACRLCRWFDTAAANSCREPIADPVTDKERANFCGYFQPRPHAHQGATDAGARAQLAALFGEAPPATGLAAAANDARQALEDLFRKA
ncbi:MAG: hypothetical protein IT494_08140 [Gammaproteobacteria bacterium]|nr:hypothetical protein [Gammaproteobacteria bacterium]